MNAIPTATRQKAERLLRRGLSIRRVSGVLGHNKNTITKIARELGLRTRQPPRAVITKSVHRKKFWCQRNGVSQYYRYLRNLSVREQAAILLAMADRPLTKEEVWNVLRAQFPDLKLFALSRILNHNGDYVFVNINGLFSYDPNAPLAFWIVNDKELSAGSPRLLARAIWHKHRGLKDKFVVHFRERYEERLLNSKRDEERLKKVETLRAVEESRLVLQLIASGKELLNVLSKQ